MRKFYLLATFLIISGTAIAGDPGTPCQGQDPITGGCGTAGTTLPINHGVVYLLVAGIIIGIIAMKKYNSLKPAMVTNK
jgi:hypothetical protein